jgi:hypothetical protein
MSNLKLSQMLILHLAKAQCFKKVYEQAQQDEKNWWERAASVSSVPESPAIFTMSPVSSPIESPQLQQKSGFQ